MGEIGDLLAAVAAKLFDPLIIAAGVGPALVSRRAASLLVAALVGAGLGLFVYVMSVNTGRPVALLVLPICGAAAALWWAAAVIARRHFVRPR